MRWGVAASQIYESAEIAKNIALWAMIIAASFFVLVTIVLPGLVFIVALLEPIRAPTYPAMNQEPLSRELIDEAVKQGFRLIGHFKGAESGIQSKFTMTFALSPDPRVLLMIQHSISKGITLMSRFPDSTWLLTTTIRGRGELALESSEQIPGAKLEALTRYHNLRLASSPEPALAFDPATATANITEHYRQQMEQQVATGMARYAARDRSTVKHTVRGAWDRAVATIRLGFSAREREARAKAKLKELEWGLVKDGER